MIKSTTQTIEAVYEDNVLKPIKPLKGIMEHQNVVITIHPHPTKKGLRDVAGTLTHDEAEEQQKLINEEFEKNERDILLFANNSILMSIDEAAAIRYAKVRYDLKKKGNPIPENDIWIAALCLVQNVPLLSNDGHFDKINGLEVINWQ